MSGYEDLLSYEEEYARRVFFYMGGDDQYGRSSSPCQESTLVQGQTEDTQTGEKPSQSECDGVLMSDAVSSLVSGSSAENGQQEVSQVQHQGDDPDLKEIGDVNIVTDILGEIQAELSARASTLEKAYVYSIMDLESIDFIDEGVSEDFAEPSSVTRVEPVVHTDGTVRPTSATAHVVTPVLSPAEIMGIYNDREKAFVDKVMSRGKKGSDCVSLEEYIEGCDILQTVPFMGLEYMQKLVRVMEHLSNLREENVILKQKCAFLEETKQLLKLRHDVLANKEHHVKSRSKTWTPSKVMHYLTVSHGASSSVSSSNKTYSEESSHYANSDMSSKHPKLHSRSQSVGSIEIADVDISAIQEAHLRSQTQETSVTKDEPTLPASQLTKTKSKKITKWDRVKKVFGGKSEASKSADYSEITAEQLVKANSKNPLHPKPALLHVMSVDSALCAGLSDTNGSKLSEEKRAMSRSIPQLSSINTAEPITPRSVNSDPGTDTQDVEHSDFFGDNRSLSMPATPVAKVAPDSLGVDVLHNSSSMSSSFHSEESNDFQETEACQTEMKPSSKQTEDGHVVVSLRRRKSSPTLSTHSHENIIGQTVSRSSSLKGLKKSASDLTDMGKQSHVAASEVPAGKKTKSPWLRVKDIIQTRKESLKRKNKPLGSGHTPESVTPEPDGDSCPESVLVGSYTENNSAETATMERASRARSPKKKGRPRRSSPADRRRSRKDVRSMSMSPTHTHHDFPHGLLSTMPLDVNAIVSGLSDDFNKKMHEWEKKKKLNKESCNYGEDDKAEMQSNFTDDFITKMEEWEKIKGLGSPVRRGNESTSGAESPMEGSFLVEEEVQQHLSQSFSNTVKEWERVKTQRLKDTGSPTNEPSKFEHGRSRKTVRSKSRDRSRDRSRSKFERLREKELHKIEKKEQKIEKQKIKLEKLKIKLDMEAEYNVAGLSEDFAQKLHEWEVMKGISSEVTPAQPTCKSPTSPRQVKEAFRMQRKRAPSEGYVLSPLQKQRTVPNEESVRTPSPRLTRTRSCSSPVMPSEAKKHDRDSSYESHTDEWYNSVLDENDHLHRELANKEEDISQLQDDILQLTDRITAMDQEHNQQINKFKRELWASSYIGHYQVESDLLQKALSELENKLRHVQHHSQQVMWEKQQLQLESIQQSESRKAKDRQILEELKQLQFDLDDRAKIGVKQDFDEFYGFVLSMLDQLRNLYLSIQDQNRVLEEMRHHLLIQEVTNKLLIAETERLDVQINHYRRAQKSGVIKRWHTFSAKDVVIREDGTLCIGGDSPAAKRAKLNQLCLPTSSTHRTKPLTSLLSDVDLNASLHLGQHLLNSLKTRRNHAEAELLARLETEKLAVEIQTDTMTPSVCSVSMQTSEEEVINNPVQLPESRSIHVQTSFDICEDISTTTGKDSVDSESSPVKTSKPKLSRTMNVSSVESADSLKCDEKPCNEPLSVPENMQEVYTEPTHNSQNDTTNMEGDGEQENDDSMDEQNSVVIEAKTTPVRCKMIMLTPMHSFDSYVEMSVSEPVTPNRRVSDIGASTSIFEAFDAEAQLPQPPHSPIIRSKYPRKIRTDIKKTQINADSKVWHATPPRRAIRHRKFSSDKQALLGIGDKLQGSQSEGYLEPMRERTRSDSSTLFSRKCEVSSGTASSYEFSFKDRKTLTGYELAGYVGNNTLDPFYGFRKSPSPSIRKPTVSPVRKLKTAQELMQDSELRRYAAARRSGSATRGTESNKMMKPNVQTRDKLPSTSSDKENNKDPCPDNVDSNVIEDIALNEATGEVIIIQSANQSQRETPVTSESVQAVESQAVNSPLKDLTNDSQEKTRRSSSGSSNVISKSLGSQNTDVNVNERSGENSKQCSTSSSDSKKTEKIDVSIEETCKPKLKTDTKSKQSTPKGNKEETQTSKSSKKQTKTGGAVTTLCRQALSVEVSDGVTGEEAPTAAAATSEEGASTEPAEKKRSTRNKLLDAAWFQKPRKLFKVSKC